MARIVSKLSLFVGSGDLIMVGHGWSWGRGWWGGLWLVVGGGGKIMAGRGWWWRTYAWSWVAVGGGGKIMAGRGWSWMVVSGHTI